MLTALIMKFFYSFQIIFFYELEFIHSAYNRNGNGNDGKEKFTPYFSKPIANTTAVLGRSAILECSVENLGPFNKVAWLKMDSSNLEPTVLTIGTDTLFGERKYKVSQNGDRQWFLHIKHVRVSDRGNYMCQVNSEKMISQVGHLDVQVPPILIEDRTSSDTTVDEHQKAILKCTAKGYPRPKISWRREDGQPINLGQFGGQKYSVQTFDGSQLNLTQVTREDMGAYLCIASNGVPPSLSRRVLLHVNFRPKIRVPNQLISATIGSRIELVCMCEAYPRPLVTWITPTEIGIVTNHSTSHRSSGSTNDLTENLIVKKFEAKEDYHGYRVTMRLIIHYLTNDDFGSFKCIAKNILGEKEGLIRVYEDQSVNKPEIPVTKYGTNAISTFKLRKSKNSGQHRSSMRNNMENNDNNSNEDEHEEMHYENNDYNIHSNEYDHDDNAIFVNRPVQPLTSGTVSMGTMQQWSIILNKFVDGQNVWLINILMENLSLLMAQKLLQMIIIRI